MKKRPDPDLDAITHEYLVGDIGYAEYKRAVIQLAAERRKAVRDNPDRDERELEMER